MIRGHVDEFYTAYLEHTLPEPLRQEVEAHLRECPQCAAELTELCQVVECLHDLPMIAAPEGFAEAVRTSLPRVPRRVPAWRMALPAVAAAAVLVLVSVGFWQFRGAYLRQQPQTVAGTPRDNTLPHPLTTPRTESGVELAPSADADSTTETPTTAKTQPEPETPEQVLKSFPQLKDVASPTSSAGESAAPKRAAAPRESQPMTSAASEPPAPQANALNAPAPVPAPAAAERTLSDAYEPQPQARVGRAEVPSMTKAASPRLSGGMLLEFAEGDGQSLQLDEVVVQMNAQVVSGEKAGQVQLVMQTPTATTVRISGASSKWQNTQQLAINPPGGSMMLDIPAGGDGGSLKMTFTFAGKTETAYLFTPGVGPRKTTVDVQAANQSMLQLLQQLANESGVYIFAPGDFAQRTVTLSLRLSPIAVLNTLANQQNAQALHAGKIVTITPK